MKYLVAGVFTVLCAYLIELLILNFYGEDGELKKINKEGIKKFVKSKLQLKLILRILFLLILNLYLSYKFTNMIVLGLYNVVFILLYYIAIIDYKTKYIDNKLFYSLLIIGIVSLFIDNNVNLSNGIITGGMSFGFLCIVSKLSKDSFGMGDSMIIGALGLIFGYRGLIMILLLAGILVFITAIIILFRNFSKNRKKELPFTPYIFLGLMILVIMVNR